MRTVCGLTGRTLVHATEQLFCDHFLLQRLDVQLSGRGLRRRQIIHLCVGVRGWGGVCVCEGFGVSLSWSRRSTEMEGE